MSDIVVFRTAIVDLLKSTVSVPVYRQVTAKTALPYVRVSPIASRRRDMSISGLAFQTTLRLYVETARGSGDEAWNISDQVIRAIDGLVLDLSPHSMSNMFVTNAASIVDIALEMQSIAIDVFTTLSLGE